MQVKQISVFLENKEGRIRDAIKILGEANINILALSIAETTKYGIMRLIVSDYKKAIEEFEKNSFVVREDEVLIVTVPDEPNGLNTTLSIIDSEKINIEYLYAFSSIKIEKAIVVIKIETMEDAIKLFEEKGVTLLSQNDLNKLN